MNIPPSKYAIQHEIETIEQIEEWYRRLKDRKQKLSDTLTNYVRETLKGFSGVKVCDLRFNREGGPKIELYCSSYPYKVHYTGEQRFVVTRNGNISRIYSNEILDKEPPFDGEKVLALCEKLTEQLGVSVMIHKTEVIDVVEEAKEYRQLKVAHKTGTIVDSGVIEYKGWDCRDEWAVVDDIDGRHFYCGTGGHGQGYTHHIRPGEDYSEIAAFLRTGDVFVSEVVFSYFPEAE